MEYETTMRITSALQLLLFAVTCVLLSGTVSAVSNTDFVERFEASNADTGDVVTDGRSSLVLDVNGDGLNDLVIGHDTGSMVLVFVALSQVGEAVTYDTPLVVSTPFSAVGRMWALDFDQDGDMDILMRQGASYGQLAMLSNDGNGASWTSFSLTTSTVYDCAVADFNVDSYPDLVCAMGSSLRYFENVVSYEEEEDRFFIQNDLATVNAQTIASLDFNLDTAIDIVVGAGTTGYISFFQAALTSRNILGRREWSIPSSATRLHAHLSSTSYDISHIAVGYINGDNIPDIYYTLRNRAEIGILLLTTNSISSASDVDLATTASDTRRLQVADLDGDQVADAVFTLDDGITYIMDGATKTVHTLSPSPSYDVALGDLDNDGIVDIVGTTATSHNHFYTFVNQLTTPASDPTPPAANPQASIQFVGSSEFFATHSALFNNVVLVESIDVDGDGTGEVVVGDRTDTLTVFKRTGLTDSEGHPTFNVLSTFTLGNAYPIKIWKINADDDGDNDLLILTNVGSLYLAQNGDDLGSGDGASWTIHTVDTANSIVDCDVGDMNLDGVDDIMCTRGGTTLVYKENTYLKHQNPTTSEWFTKKLFTATYNAFNIQLLDFDSDGDLDFVYTTSSSDRILFYKNNLAAPTITGERLISFDSHYNFYDSSSQPTGIAVGFFNGDSVPDIVFTNRNEDDVNILLLSYSSSLTVSSNVKLDTGSYTSATNTGFIKVADLDSDGDQDIVLIRGVGSVDGPFLLRNTGNGVFENPVPLYKTDSGVTNTNAAMFYLGVFDWDLDGDIDIVHPNDNRGLSSVYYNQVDTIAPTPNPLYTLDPATTPRFVQTSAIAEVYSTELTGARGLAYMDVTGDGVLDMIVGNHLTDQIYTFRGLGSVAADGTPEYELYNSCPFINPSKIEFADLDDDGDMDLIVTDTSIVPHIVWNGDHFGTSGSNPGTGAFTSDDVYSFHGEVGRCEYGDLNLDGHTDMVCSGSGAVLFYENRITIRDYEGALPFVRQALIVPGVVYDVTLFDFDNDGDLDVAYTTLTSDTYSIYRNDLGSPDIFGRRRVSLTHRTTQVISSDDQAYITNGFINGDSVPDLLIMVRNRANVLVSIVTSSGLVSSNYEVDSYYSGNTDMAQIHLVDMDSDGDNDALVCRSDGSFYALENVNNVLTTGNSLYFSGSDSTVYTGYSCGAADIDNDGDLDLFVAGGNNEAQWYMNRVGTAPPAQAPLYTPGAITSETFTQNKDILEDHPELATARAVYFEDVSGDGNLDLISLDQTTDLISTYFGLGTVDAKGNPNFGEPVSFTFVNPRAAQFADLDNDGDIDMIVTDTSEYVHTVFNGNEGTSAQFSASSTYFLSGALSHHCDIGDFNLDGYVDLVCGERLAAHVVWYENLAGERTPFSVSTRFSKHILVTGVFNAAGTALFDFDNDGDLDVAVTTRNSDQLIIYRNNLGPVNAVGKRIPSLSATNTQTYSSYDTLFITSGFINGDNIPDLVFVNEVDNRVTQSLVTSSGVVSSNIYLSHPYYTGDSRSGAIGLADLDGDGDLDAYTCSSNNGLTVFENVGGSLTTTGVSPYFSVAGATVDEESALSAYMCSAQDIDGDGAMDLVVSGLYGPIVFMNKATEAAPAQPPRYTLGATTSNLYTASTDVYESDSSLFGNPRDVQMGDINGDGFVDLIVSDDSTNSLRVLRNTGAFNSARQPVYEDFGTVGSSDVHYTELHDMDGDGDLDIVAITYYNGAGKAGKTVRVFDNENGDGSVWTELFSTTAYDFEVADLDKDGILDIVYSYTNIFFVRQVPAKTYETAVEVGTSNANAVHMFTLLDFNNDGLLDFSMNEYSGNTIRIFRNTATLSDGRYPPSYSQTQGLSYTLTHADITSADMDQDGIDDVIFTYANADYYILYLTSSGTVASSIPVDNLFNAESNTGRLVPFDVNEDGYPDIIWAGKNGVSVMENTQSRSAGIVSLLFNSPHSLVADSFATNSIGFGDFDQDDDIDIVIPSYSSSTPVVFLSNQRVNYETEFLQPIYRSGNSLEECAKGTYGGDCQCNSYDDDGEITTLPVELDPAVTSIANGKLTISFTEEIKYKYLRYRRPTLAFLDNDGNEKDGGSDACTDLFQWTVTEPLTDCGVRKWVGIADAVTAIAGADGCMFESLVTGSGEDEKDVARFRVGVTDYEWVNLQEGDGDQENGDDTDEYILREHQHMFSFDIEFPRSISLSTATVEVFSEVVAARALVQQVVSLPSTGSVFEPRIGVDMFVSLQHPFYPSYSSGAVSTPDNSAFTVNTGGLSVVSTDCLNVDNVDCSRVFRWEIDASAPKCDFDGTYSIVFDVQCNPAYTDECPLNGGETFTITYTLDTDSACGSVVDTVVIEASLDSYPSNSHSSTKDEFIQDDVIYFQADITSPDVSLTNVELHSLSITGGSISPVNIMASGTPNAGLVTSYDMHHLGASGGTVFGDAETNLKPTFDLLAKADLLGVGTRSTDTFTVTAEYSVTYSTSFTPSSSAADRQRLSLLSQGHSLAPRDENHGRVHHKTLSFGSKSATVDTAVKVSDANSASSSSSSEVNLAATSNLVLFAVVAVTLILVGVAAVSLRRASAAKRDLASDLALEGTPTNHNNV